MLALCQIASCPENIQAVRASGAFQLLKEISTSEWDEFKQMASTVPERPKRRERRPPSDGAFRRDRRPQVSCGGKRHGGGKRLERLGWETEKARPPAVGRGTGRRRRHSGAGWQRWRGVARGVAPHLER
eukprot:796659-Prorocentrum_minimum.AAC.1